MSLALLARLTCDGCGATADVPTEVWHKDWGPLRIRRPDTDMPDDWTIDHGRDLCPSCTARGKETR